jgi:flagellar hook protein FlgE
MLYRIGLDSFENQNGLRQKKGQAYVAVKSSKYFDLLY